MFKWIDEFSFRFAQCETSWMGETWMLKSPRTWHNSLLERLYWLVWIMCLIWFNICQWSIMTAILCNKIMWNQGTGWQIGIHHSPPHPPQRCLRQSTWPFSTPTWGTPPKKKTHLPPLHTKPGINSPSFTTAFHSLQKTEPSWYLSTLTQPPYQLLSWPYYFCFFLLNQRHYDPLSPIYK